MKLDCNFMKKYTYISLFSSAGVGCYGFKQKGFECVATSELLEKRLNIQKHNKKCKYDSGYITGDISLAENQQKIFSEIQKWKNKEKLKEIDVVIATPPCQGMSVANHKKKDEKNRNSLIVESIKLVKDISPRYFVFENVRSFLNTICFNVDGSEISISNAIDINLAGKYNILKRVVNFKNYGSCSSRTRTLIVGVRKDIKDITPFDIFPPTKQEKILKQVIGKYPRLSTMGEINENDIYHHFRIYNKRMLSWIENIKEGESAFDNKNSNNRPHQIKDGKIYFNQNKNADKYKRCEWNKIAPCIHTRNDIMSSQSTVHPVDNRVFSIRELMDLMTIPQSFKWVQEDIKTLNTLSLFDKELFLKKEAMNIRQSIGESVPTVIFQEIAKNIIELENNTLSTKKIKEIIVEKKLDEAYGNLYDFISINANKLHYNTISRIVEFANKNKNSLAAFYTPQSVCYNLVKELPDFNQNTIHVLEPSVGIGNFIPLLSQKYWNKKIILDVVDVDNNILELLKLLHIELKFKNIEINYINEDFLQYTLYSEKSVIKNKYDIIIGNPPFGKVKCSSLRNQYRAQTYNKSMSNLFAFFLEKSLRIANYVAMITPKSLLSAPEFNKTRELIENNFTIKTIIDHGEKGFDGIKIETIASLFQSKKINDKYPIKVESYITESIDYHQSSDIFDTDFNLWLLYTNAFFKKVKEKLHFSIYDFYRDRSITKMYTASKGKFRVLKSRNLKDCDILNINGYDTYLDDIDKFGVKKYLNSDSILIPNLSYKPRACFMPSNSIADGSIAILQPKNGYKITKQDLEYYATEEFRKFYMIGRNLGTRSLNIDSNSINLWGLRKGLHKNEHRYK